MPILFGENREKIQKLYWQIPRQEVLGYLGGRGKMDSSITISVMQAAQFFTQLFLSDVGNVWKLEIGPVWSVPIYSKVNILLSTRPV